MKLRYTRKAFGHLVEIHTYTEQEWPGTSQEVGKTIEQAVRQLCSIPSLGELGE